MPLPTRAWLSSSRIGRIVRARSIPTCTLGLFCVVSTFREVDHFPHASCRPNSNVGYVARTHFLHARGYPLPALGVLSAPAPFPCAGSRPNSSVGYVARTYFPHARGYPLHALGALPAHSLHSRVDAIASFQRWPRCPHPLPARTWLSSSSVGSIVHTRSVPACARLAFRQFPPGKINTKPHANASRGRRRFAARPVRAVAPDISRQLYFQRADFVPPVLHRA